MPAVNILRNNSFMKKYYKVCSDLKSEPLPDIKVCFPNKTLEVIGDSIKANDWLPILKALSCDRSLTEVKIKRQHFNQVKYLKHINTESKARKAKQGVVLSSCFIIDSLSKALFLCLKGSRALSSLHLQGLCLQGEAINNLCKGLEFNTSLQQLSLLQCPITNGDCRKICDSIQNRPNIRSLEFRACDIKPRGALHIAEMIKFQEIAREELWCKGFMGVIKNKNNPMGIQRINLNLNENLGNEGLQYILQALFDNDGVKAIDMKNCGITSLYGGIILELLRSNTNIVVFDLKDNPDLDVDFLGAVRRVLRENCIKSCKKYNAKPSNSELVATNIISDLIKSLRVEEPGVANDSKNNILEEDEQNEKSGLWIKPIAFNNPFANISEKNVKEFVEKMSGKWSGGQVRVEKVKSIYEKLLDGSVQELNNFMSPGLSAANPIPKMTPFGIASEISVSKYIKQCTYVPVIIQMMRSGIRSHCQTKQVLGSNVNKKR